MSQLTITGITGPGVSNTAVVLQNLQKIEFDLVRRVIKVVSRETTDSIDKTSYYDYGQTATVTYTISGVNATVTISS